MNFLRTLVLVASAAVAILLGGSAASMAGTTGGIRGDVIDDSGSPVAGASVSVVSPSGSAASTTDTTGHFVFLTLQPDTYTLTVSKSDAIETTEITGVTVIADQFTRIPVKVAKFVKTLGTISVRTAANLVKPGLTTVVYTIDPTTYDIAHAMGGNAYNQNNIYGILQLVPGTSQHRGLTNNSFTIRGGQPDQVGFEYDGVPVNRAFDNSNALTGSTVGMQQLQVYTGGGPPSLQGAQTSTGFVNEVIKSGAYPGFTTLTLGLADPTMYNGVLYEHGGGSPNGRFSYFFASGTFDVKQRYYTQFDGVGLHPWVYGFNPYAEPVPSWGSHSPDCVTATTGPNAGQGGQDPVLTGAIPLPQGGDTGCAFWAYPPALFTPDIQANRDSVLNLHFALPHRNGTLKDDIQFLASNGYQTAQNRDSIFDAGGFNQIEAFNHNFSITPYWSDTIVFGPGVQWGQAVNASAPYPQLPLVAYKTPGSPQSRCANIILGLAGACPNGDLSGTNFSLIPATARTGTSGQYGVLKLQFTRSLTQTSYLRLYGYTLYSGSFTNGATGAGSGGLCCYSSGDEPPDYELSTHTRGVSAQYANQLSSKHLLFVSANYSTQHALYFNNSSLSQFSNDTTGGTQVTNLVSFDSSGNPTCYVYGNFQDPSNPTIGQPTYCDNGDSRGTFANPAQSLGVLTIPSTTPGSFLNPCNPCWGPFDPANQAAYAASPAGMAGAQWIVTESGYFGGTNTVRPAWSSFAIQDQFSPNDKLQINADLRLDRQTYSLPNTNSPAYNFWFAAARHELWYDPATGQPWTSRNTNFNNTTGPGGIVMGLQCPTSTVPATTCSGPGAPVHPDGLNGHLLYTNTSPASINDQTFEPGMGMTYTFNPDTVVRFHAGVGSDPTGSSNIMVSDASVHNATLNNYATWFGLGYPNLSHNLKPRTATNVDVSYERHFKGTDLSMTVTPFYRNTQNEYISSVSATFPGANFLTRGIEFQIEKGRADQNGFAGYLSYTYTKEVMHLLDNPLTGTNPIDSWNYYIDAYNALTAQGDRNGNKGAMCYAANNASNPDPTGAAPAADCSVQNGQIVMTTTGIQNGDVINPFYFDPAQPGYDRSAWYYANLYVPTSQAAPGPGARIDSFIPHQFAGYLSYRHNKLRVAPYFNLWGGTKYGSPLDLDGIDPRSCTANESGYTQYDPGVYGSQNATGPNGFPWQQVTTAPNPGLLNWISCGGAGFINGYYAIVPRPDTHQFSQWAQYTNPWHFNLGATFNYDLTSTITTQLNVSNIVNYCFGGSKEPWTSAYPADGYTCSYQYNPWNIAVGYWNGSGPNDSLANGPPMSNYFNQIYAPVVDTWPLNATFTVKIRL